MREMIGLCALDVKLTGLHELITVEFVKDVLEEWTITVHGKNEIYLYSINLLSNLIKSINYYYKLSRLLSVFNLCININIITKIVISLFLSRINNCVGERNQKYFIQFLVYVGMLAVYAITLVIVSWVNECPLCSNDVNVKQSRMYVYIFSNYLKSKFIFSKLIILCSIRYSGLFKNIYLCSFILNRCPNKIRNSFVYSHK